MPEYTAIATQTVAANQNVLFTETPIPCTKGLVTHRAGSGLFNLRGNCSQCRARYKVDFGGNIAVSAGGTAGPISIAIAVDGEPLTSSIATVTPTAAEAFFNVATSEYIDVTKGCCASLSIRNVSGQSIDVSNANLIVTRVC